MDSQVLVIQCFHDHRAHGRPDTVIWSKTQISGCDQLDVVNIRKSQQQLREGNRKTTDLEERKGQPSSHISCPHRNQAVQRKECGLGGQAHQIPLLPVIYPGT